MWIQVATEYILSERILTVFSIWGRWSKIDSDLTSSIPMKYHRKDRMNSHVPNCLISKSFSVTLGIYGALGQGCYIPLWSERKNKNLKIKCKSIPCITVQFDILWDFDYRQWLTSLNYISASIILDYNHLLLHWRLGFPSWGKRTLNRRNCLSAFSQLLPKLEK